MQSKNEKNIEEYISYQISEFIKRRGRHYEITDKVIYELKEMYRLELKKD